MATSRKRDRLRRACRDVTAMTATGLTPDRLAEVNLRRVAQGAGCGAERAAEHRAGQRHADCGPRERADPRAHDAARQGAVAWIRAATRDQKRACDHQYGHMTHDFAPQRRKAPKYRSQVFSKTILSNESMGCMARLTSYKSRTELNQALTRISDSRHDGKRAVRPPGPANRAAAATDAAGPSRERGVRDGECR